MTGMGALYDSTSQLILNSGSYDNVEAIDTSLAKEMLAKSNIFGVVLPSNISPGVFVQMTGDNNDINEET